MPWVDFSQVEEARDYSPLPEGLYPCRITVMDASLRTQAGDEMWKVRFTVESGEFAGREVHDQISFGPKALSRVKLLCSRAGLDVSAGLNVSPAALNGRSVLVGVVVEDYQDRQSGQMRKRNKIPFAGFFSIDAGVGIAPSDSVPAPSPFRDDDLPF